MVAMSEPTIDPTPGPSQPPTFEQRMDAFGREADAAGKRMEAAGKRWAADPSVTRVADTAARAWGVILLAAGVWFFLDVTLAMDMPSVPWGDLWPFALVLVGLVIVARGMGRRSA